MATIQVAETFRETTFFTTVGGFASTQDFSNFCRTWGIQKHVMGYPVFAIMTALNKARKNRTVAGGLQEELTTVKIEKEKTLIAIKRHEFIPRDLAVNRIRITLMATASKLKYAIKMAAPRVCGLFHAPDVENVLTECYNAAMEQLYLEAEQIESWETYGTQNQRSDVQSGGADLATAEQTDSSAGCDNQDSSVGQEQCP